MRFTIPVIAIVLSACAPGSEPKSTYNLGVDAYLSKDYAKAYSHWSEAAVHGNVDALNNLGYLAHNGYGVRENQEEAIRLWRTASFAGHSESQWHLGKAHEDGSGIERDLAKAYAWYACAIASATYKLNGESAERGGPAF